jgi:hypothetical protein
MSRHEIVRMVERSSSLVSMPVAGMDVAVMRFSPEFILLCG